MDTTLTLDSDNSGQNHYVNALDCDLENIKEPTITDQLLSFAIWALGFDIDLNGPEVITIVL